MDTKCILNMRTLIVSALTITAAASWGQEAASGGGSLAKPAKDFEFNSGHLKMPGFGVIDPKNPSETDRHGGLLRIPGFGLVDPKNPDSPEHGTSDLHVPGAGLIDPSGPKGPSDVSSHPNPLAVERLLRKGEEVGKIPDEMVRGGSDTKEASDSESANETRRKEAEEAKRKADEESKRKADEESKRKEEAIKAAYDRGPIGTDGNGQDKLPPHDGPVISDRTADKVAVAAMFFVLKEVVKALGAAEGVAPWVGIFRWTTIGEEPSWPPNRPKKQN